MRRLRALGTSFVPAAIWKNMIAKAPGIVNTSLISLWYCTKDLEKKRSRKQRSKGCETCWEQECNGHDGYYCDANMLLWRFKMAHGTFSMLDAIVMFQDGADLEPTPTTSSQFFVLGTCTGCPQTQRTANDSIRKRLLHRHNNQINVYHSCK